MKKHRIRRLTRLRPTDGTTARRAAAVTRRQFLAGAGAAVLAPWTKTAAADAPPARPQVKLAIATYSYWHFRPPKTSIETVIERASDLGVNGVDVLHRQMDSEEKSYLQKL